MPMPSLARPVARARWRRLATALSVVTAAALGVVTFVVAPARPASAGGQALVSPTYSPNPNWSTAGDFALDIYGDPWDFSNGEDFPVEVGAEGPGMGVSNLRMSGGGLAGTGNPGSNFSFVYAWETPPGAPPTYRLPWGRDGAKQPIDANRYRVLSFQLYASGAADGAVRWFRADGTVGVKPFRFQQGWNHYDLDLGTDPTWAGTVTTMGIVRGNEGLAPDLQFDWVSLHRGDTRGFDPSAGVGAATVTAPSEAGDGSVGSWAPLTPGGVAVLTEAVGGYDGNGLHATSIGHDPSVELNLPAGGFDGSRYHRATVSICYDGDFSLSGDPGGGMIGRFAWFVAGAPQWTESQDIIVFPGCQNITIDLDTNPPGAVHDEESGFRPGFTCQQIVRFRFDPDEDPGRRGFHIAGIRLGQDPSFSTSYPITFHDATGSATSADIFVGASPSPDGAVQIARGVGLAAGQGTFNWNGTDARGNRLPAGSYYVFVKANGKGGSTTTVSSAPVRYDAPAATGLGTYESITPARILDTRDGTGRGCVTGVGQSRSIDVPVTGVGGVPNGA